MKKLIFIGMFAALMSTVLTADDARKNPGPRRMRISPPIYGSRPHDMKNPAEMSPEQRKVFEAARKRRLEIMVLIGAYKIMPEGQREALRSELLKRIQEDFNASIAIQKARIAKAEEDLKKLRTEVAEREANSSKLIEGELDRLLKLPMPGSRHNGKGPRKFPEKRK